MHYVRPVDEAEELPTGHPGLRAKLLSHQESAMIFMATVQEGGRAAGLHYHDRDQVYFQLRGTMTARLADDIRQIGPKTLVYIPAGLPHCNWNEGPGDESHLEVITPTTQIGAPLAHMVDADQSLQRDALGSVTIVEVHDEQMIETTDGDRRQRLIGLTTTTPVNIDYVEFPIGAGWPHVRIRHADKHYFVLSGCLDFEIALTQHSAGPNTLVSLPAGVPHRIVNNGSVATTLEMTTVLDMADNVEELPVHLTLSCS